MKQAAQTEPQEVPPKKPLRDTEQAAKRINTTTRWLEYQRTVGGGPKYVKLSRRCVRYRDEDLDEFIETKIIGSTSAG